MRGAARLTAHGDGDDVVLDGTRALTWTERQLEGVRHLTLDLDGTTADGPEFAVDRGLVRVSRVTWGHEPTPQDRDDDTRAGIVPRAARHRADPPAPSRTASPVARLVLSSGEVVDVDRPVLVGRAPQVRSFTPAQQPHLVTVPSPHHEISSTHLEVRPGSGADSGTATATDLGSTNGSVLVQPGLPPEDLRPGIAVSLVPGAVIDLGDDVTIRVARPLRPR